MSAMQLRPNAASFPGSKSKRTMFSIHPKVRKLLAISSRARASSSFITSCSDPSGMRAARVAHSTWTIPTARWCIWRNGTCLLWRFHERQSPKSKHSRNEWVGGSTGCRLTRVTSTAIITSPLQKKSLQKGIFTTSGQAVFPAKKPLESVSFTRKERTYSTFARGGETVLNTYNYLDLVPKGRDEDGLYFPMAWVRHHDRYEDRRLADVAKPYWPAETKTSTVEDSTSSCCSAEQA